jgi:hypothetical protein
VQKELAPQQGGVNCTTLLPNLLSVLRPTEEIRLLRELSRNRPKAAQYLRETYASLAFLGEWPSDKLKNIFNSARPQELVALVHTMPELKNDMYALLPTRTQAMISEDLEAQTPNDAELDVLLENIRRHVNDIVDSGELDLKSFFHRPQAQSRFAA